MESISNRIVRGLWKTKEIGWKDIPSMGYSGGILVIGMRGVLNCEMMLGECSILYLFEDRRHEWRWAFICMYNRGEKKEKDLLWKDLDDCKQK